MNNIERKQEIVRRVQEHGSVQIAELADEFGVSTMTIRRDLSKLADEGIVRPEYGGASRREDYLFEYSIQQKLKENAEEKSRIAEACLSFIHEGDSIFIDAGTTTAAIAERLPQDMELLVMTNSLLVANCLSSESKAKVIMCPGEYRAKSMAYLGSLTIDFVANFKVQTLFLGTESIVPSSGLAVPDISDGMTKKALVRQAKNVVCAADSGKFHQPFLYQFCKMDDIDTIVTDSRLDAEQRKLIHAAGVGLITA